MAGLDDLDAEGHERVLEAERTLGDAGLAIVGRSSRGGDHVAIDALELDRRVGRQDDHDFVVGPIDRRHGQRDGRCGVPAGRLGEDADAGQLGGDEAAVAAVGDDRDRVLGPEDRPDAGGRPLQERLIAEQRQERFRPLGRAERPQAGASPAGEDHDMHRAPF